LYVVLESVIIKITNTKVKVPKNSPNMSAIIQFISYLAIQGAEASPNTNNAKYPPTKAPKN